MTVRADGVILGLVAVVRRPDRIVLRLPVLCRVRPARTEDGTRRLRKQRNGENGDRENGFHHQKETPYEKTRLRN
jgi:hypothetical protein